MMRHETGITLIDWNRFSQYPNDGSAEGITKNDGTVFENTCTNRRIKRQIQ